MDFYLRCNSLKCRSQLKKEAVVTTCSHIFCLQCAGNLGLSRPISNERRCPACQASLLNPADAISTILNPPEDYKTSVLSGLDPNTIIECASRALLFWSYQTTQEICYQEFLGKTLTEKYANLNQNMDKAVHDSSSEIASLNDKISELQEAQGHLQKKNEELEDLYRHKSRKLTQVTNLYNILKTRTMRTDIQTAASDSVAQTLRSLATHTEQSTHRTPVQNMAVLQPPSRPVSHQLKPYYIDKEGVDRVHRYQRCTTSSSRGTKRKTDAHAMPPPNQPARSIKNTMFTNATPRHQIRLPEIQTSTSTSDSMLSENAIYQQRFGGPHNYQGYQASLRGPAASTNDRYAFMRDLRKAPQTTNLEGFGSKSCYFP
ncbi:hypothetical protein ASPZODRAFT_657237 [Penicilliopsis zonata CBS 506.65]|uniref:RING-type domain-containing protein n=1 Tax=Penicilliopsis zonata CBS 506.65 TaxID=1073090 RepID=A0A1L9SCL1_9EURO|nr:hypothetical protein ASPZODRAFT_657237 [Penicilliopsis zonata CBS 506.65]OJJ44955.1 hypothetical protein ASPZODRAFT_657237 [Penicilliopsis zonata CBS 506.65]